MLIKGGRVIDPESGLDGEMDILVGDGRILKVSKGITDSDATRFDVGGKLVFPGFIDMHTHLREPGREDEETIETGTASAAAGGFVRVTAMPNTEPPMDSAAAVRSVYSKAREVGKVHVSVVGCITKGRRGEELAPMGELRAAGVVAVSDDGNCVARSNIMRYAMEYASMLGLPVISHAEDVDLAGEGVMNEGLTSTMLGLPGIPNAAEEVIVARDLILAELTGAHLHVAHVSTEGSVRLIREAKRRGVRVTCEVTPHHFSLTDEACRGYDTNTKVNPPLRSKRDVEALHEGLRDGTIDVIATDHAPHSREEKDVEYNLAPPGLVGLETALGLAFTRLVLPGILSLPELCRKLATNPARILGIPGGRISPGEPADLTIVDPEARWKVDVNRFRSRSGNSPFGGWELVGAPYMTVVAGKVAFLRGEER